MNTLNCILGSLLTGVLCLGGPPKLRANLVINGDFESPGGIVGWHYLSASPDGFGWQISQSIDLLGAGWQPASGAQSIDLNGGGIANRGAVYQDLETTIGAIYYLSFAFAGNPEAVPRIKTMRVWWGDEVLATLSFNITGHSVGDMGWRYHEFPVTAETELTRLMFESLEDTFNGPALDDVVLGLSAKSPLGPSLPPVITEPQPTPGYPPCGAFPVPAGGPHSCSLPDTGSTAALALLTLGFLLAGAPRVASAPRERPSRASGVTSFFRPGRPPAAPRPRDFSAGGCGAR